MSSMPSTKPAVVTPPQPAQPGSKSETATRKLVVGRGIVFSGEITSCDCLVVEGTVKANIAGCHDINIAKGGLFTGSASVESAEIRGRFEGALNVSGRLLVHANGKVAAEVRYHQLEVERGGEISGQIQAQGATAGQPAQVQAPTPMPRRA
jgi:cytoskeletal protein CcmA (bactofilin family)